MGDLGDESKCRQGAVNRQSGSPLRSLKHLRFGMAKDGMVYAEREQVKTLPSVVCQTETYTQNYAAHLRLKHAVQHKGVPSPVWGSGSEGEGVAEERVG